MWRSLFKPYAKYFAPHLEDKDPAILHQALRGAGYFRLTAQADKIAKYLEDDDLREDALFAYALALPGETTRGRARGMLRKIDSITPLDASEYRLVKFAIDERLRLHGLAPVFETESEEEDDAEPDQRGRRPRGKRGGSAGPQRSVSLRQRQEVQEVSRQVAGGGTSIRFVSPYHEMGKLSAASCKL